MCGPLVSGNGAVYDSIFINYTQLMGETTHCNRIFRDKSHRIQLYMYDYSCVKLQIRYMSKLGVEFSLFLK